MCCSKLSCTLTEFDLCRPPRWYIFPDVGVPAFILLLVDDGFSWPGSNSTTCVDCPDLEVHQIFISVLVNGCVGQICWDSDELNHHAVVWVYSYLAINGRNLIRFLNLIGQITIRLNVLWVCVHMDLELGAFLIGRELWYRENPFTIVVDCTLDTSKLIIGPV